MGGPGGERANSAKVDTRPEGGLLLTAMLLGRMHEVLTLCGFACNDGCSVVIEDVAGLHRITVTSHTTVSAGD